MDTAIRFPLLNVFMRLMNLYRQILNVVLLLITYDLVFPLNVSGDYTRLGLKSSHDL